MFLVEPTYLIPMDPDCQQHIRSEFGIRLTYYDSIDLESMPDQSSRLSIRTVRDSLLRRIVSITSRRNIGS